MHPEALSTFLHRALASRLERLAELTRPEGWHEDPEALHQVRVASRRARAALEMVDPEARRTRRLLRRLTRTLGELRSLDVQFHLLDRLKDEGLEAVHQAVLEHAEEVLERHRDRTRHRLRRRLEKLPLTELDPSRLPPAETKGRLDQVTVQELLVRGARSLETPPDLARGEDADALHGLRIRVKRFRYAVEILAPRLESDPEPALEGLRELQTALGDHHDLVELEAFLWDLHSTLTARRRAVLATELLDILGLVAEERRLKFQAFQALAPALTPEAVLDRLRGAVAP